MFYVLLVAAIALLVLALALARVSGRISEQERQRDPLHYDE